MIDKNQLEVCKTYDSVVYNEWEKNDYNIGDEVKGQLILDIGSNIGMQADLFLDKGAKFICCYEPNPNNIKLLKRNLFTKPYWLYEGCVWINSNKQKLTDSKGTSTISPNGSIECHSIDINKIIDIYDKFLMKIDIEGAEYTIFTDDVIKKLVPKCEYIYAEIHDEKKNEILERFLKYYEIVEIHDAYNNLVCKLKRKG